MSKRGRALLTGLFNVTCLAFFLVESRTTRPEIRPPTMGWVFLDESLVKKIVGFPTVRSYGDIFSMDAPSSR